MSKLTPNQKAFNDIVNRLNSWKKAGEKQGISFPNFPSLNPPKRITKKYLKDLSESVPKTRKKFMETGENFTVSSPSSSSDDDTTTVSHKAPSSSSQSSQPRRHMRTSEGSRKSTAPKAPKKPSTSSTKTSSKTDKSSTPKRTRGKDKKPRKKRASSQSTSSKNAQSKKTQNKDTNAPKRTRGKDKKPRKKRSPNKPKATAPQTSLFDNIDFESDDWEEIETVTKDEVNITQLAIEYLDNLLSEVSTGINEHTMGALSSLIYSVIEDVAISEEVFEDVETGETSTFNVKAQAIVTNYEANKENIISALQVAIYDSDADVIYHEGDLHFFEFLFSQAGVTVSLNTFIACADMDGKGKVYSTETGEALY